MSDPRIAAPLLIIGAGITGLLLAQACQKEKIPYRIFDREASAPSPKSDSWVLTLHWSLPTLYAILPEDLVVRLPETYVPGTTAAAAEAASEKEKSCFIIFDLSTGGVRFQLPCGESICVSHARLRALLLTDIDVAWGKHVEGIAVEKLTGGTVVSFADGTSAAGAFLVGCDGAESMVRRLLHPTQHENFQLPVRMISCTASLPEAQIAALHALDSLPIYGLDSQTDTFLSISPLDASRDSTTTTTTTQYQVLFSYPHRPAWLGRVSPTNVPNTDIGQQSLLQTVAATWSEPFRSLLHSISLNTSVWREIPLYDYLPPPRPLDPTLLPPWSHRAVLAGEAAHAMAPFRAEGPNHAIADVGTLVPLLRSLFAPRSRAENDVDFAALVSAYEEEMLPRGELAVRASRQAGQDAHHHTGGIAATSLLVRRQFLRSDLEVAAAAAGSRRASAV